MARSAAFFMTTRWQSRNTVKRIIETDGAIARIRGDDSKGAENVTVSWRRRRRYRCCRTAAFGDRSSADSLPTEQDHQELWNGCFANLAAILPEPAGSSDSMPHSHLLCSVSPAPGPIFVLELVRFGGVGGFHVGAVPKFSAGAQATFLTRPVPSCRTEMAAICARLCRHRASHDDGPWNEAVIWPAVCKTPVLTAGPSSARRPSRRR